MIDASTFANSYNAFWNANTPTCEHFVRQLNLGNVERFRAPMKKSATAKRRALIAEFGFSLFVEHALDESDGRERRPDHLIEDAAWHATEIRLRPYAAEGLRLDREFDDEERREIDEIAGRLLRFFRNPDRSLVLRPKFSGCGFVDASEGDVVFGNTIYEVKTVDRPIRSNDVRQALIYAALNLASNQLDVGGIGLINPRLGLFFEMTLDQICPEISGRSAQEFLAIVIEAISGGDISR